MILCLRMFNKIKLQFHFAFLEPYTFHKKFFLHILVSHPRTENISIKPTFVLKILKLGMHNQPNSTTKKNI